MSEQRLERRDDELHPSMPVNQPPKAVLGFAVGSLLRPRATKPPYPVLSIQAAVLPNAFPKAVPSTDQDLLGLPLTRVGRQIVSVVGQSLK